MEARRIAVISFIILSFELACIRLVPSEVRAISYFTNLLLFSSFFGLGVGALLVRWRHLPWLFPVGAFLLFLFVFFSRGIVVYDDGGGVHYWLQSPDQRARPFLSIPLFASALLAFVLGALPFISLGQALVLAMDALPRLRAYSWDLAGSLLGTVLFTLVAFLGLPPWAWICALLILGAFALEEHWGNRWPYLIVGLSFLCFAPSARDWVWSPYYLVHYERSEERLTVWVNSMFHQEAVNFRPKGEAAVERAGKILDKFSLPYQAYRRIHSGASPERVLVLGAGTGNDAAVALANGARQVTVVEIDPVIIDLGRKYNAAAPYSDSRVTVVNDDGRRFLRMNRERYDLVVFGTLDSMTLVSGHANLRLDNYMYTAESFSDAKRALAEGGMVAAYYSVFKPWLIGRIFATMRVAFGSEIEVKVANNNYLFNTVILAGTGLATPQSLAATFSDEIPATDDWPYIYLRSPTLSPLYLGLLACILALNGGVFVLLRRAPQPPGLHLEFFFLGFAFTLLESAAIVRLALLFGTTWTVNAVVFSAALGTIFLSNFFLLRGGRLPLPIAWAGLMVFVLANYFVPVGSLLALGTALRVIACALLVGVPVFFAGVCFSSIFSEQGATGYPLGVNLVGAMTGGLFEYLSMVTGMKSVWLLILAAYFGAYVAATWARRRRSAAGSWVEQPGTSSESLSSRTV